jgi:copper ion binding protein
LVLRDGYHGCGECAGESAASYTVVGMTCNHCVDAVTEEVGSLPGVSEVNVDLDSGALTVRGDVDASAVRAAVEEAGYQLAESR